MKMKLLMLFMVFFGSCSTVISGAAISNHEDTDRPTIRKIITVNDKKVTHKNLRFGDEVLTSAQLSEYMPLEQAHGRNKRAVLKRHVNTLWTNGNVPYEINNAYSQGGTLNDAAKNTIRLAMNKIESISCIKFVPKQDSDKDFLRIISHAGCWSYVGRLGGPQELSIDADGCVHEDIIIHELLHALGFYHEQSRPDRDDHIQILWDNVDKNMQHNFEKRDDVNSLGSRYDVKSIMHYDNYAFSSNNKKTMIMKGKGNENVELGGTKLTSSDIKQLNMLYQCVVKPGGTSLPKVTSTKTILTSPASSTTAKIPVVSECNDQEDYCHLIETHQHCMLDTIQQNCRKTCNMCNTGNKIETTVETKIVKTTPEISTARTQPITAAKTTPETLTPTQKSTTFTKKTETATPKPVTNAKTTSPTSIQTGKSTTSTKKLEITTRRPIHTSTATSTIQSTKCTNKADFCDIFGTEFCYHHLYADFCHKTCTGCEKVTTTSQTTEEICRDDDINICPYIDDEHCEIPVVSMKCKRTCGTCGKTSNHM